MKATYRGLTLIELMVALTIAIILLAVGIPAFQGIQANSRAAAQANAMVTALNLARSEAVGRGVAVTVCARATDTTCGAAPGWGNGWLVFTDGAGTAGVPDGNDEVVRSFDAPRGTPTITANPAVAFVRFNSRGEQDTGANEVGFRLKQTGTTAQQDRCVSVALSGQIATAHVVDSDACP